MWAGGTCHRIGAPTLHLRDLGLHLPRQPRQPQVLLNKQPAALTFSCRGKLLAAANPSTLPATDHASSVAGRVQPTWKSVGWTISCSAIDAPVSPPCSCWNSCSYGLSRPSSRMSLHNILALLADEACRADGKLFQ